MRHCLLLLSLCACCCRAFAQHSFFGSLQANTFFYDRDTTIGASGTPHYDNLKSSTDAWLNLDYKNENYLFDLGVRLDMFNNSNLFTPGVPYSGIGIGNFYIRKRGEKYRITGGYFYDQFGSGIVFRAYEDRTLGIDNAILGIHAEADPLPQLKIKAFTGVHKNRLSLFKPVITGMNVETNFSIGEKARLIPGASIVNRVLDENSIEFLVNIIETYDPVQRFVPKYNVYVFGGYNTLAVGDFTWYVEAAGKTSEAIAGINGALINKSGHVFYSTLNYAKSRFGMALQFRRTDNFPFRTSPREILLEGVINFVPPVTRQNFLRLPSRYNAATQELEEQAYSVDLNYSPVAKKLTLNFNYSEARDFNNELKFREAIGDVEFKFKKTWRATAGAQFIQYDQLFYEGEVYGEYRLVKAITPYVEFTWKLNKKQSFNIDIQNQFTRQDFGSWFFGQIEYNIAPWFSIAVSDMYNYQPNPERIPDKKHYYQFFTAFTYESHIVTLAYAKQVAGIICTGGICRFEPAFSGLKLTLNSSF